MDNTGPTAGEPRAANPRREGRSESRQLTVSWQCALTVGLIASSLYVFATWLIDTRPLMNLNSYERAKFVDMVYGKAHKPFVYRVLVPAIVRGVREVIPDPLNYETHGKVYARFPALYGGMLYLGWELEYLTEYAVAVGVMYASLLGFGLAVKRLARSLFDMPEWWAWTLPIVAMWSLPPFFVKGTHYPYDFPQLVLFTLLLGSLAKQRWTTFYPLLFLGLLNKETSALISLVFVLAFWRRMRAGLLVRHLTVQLALCAGVKLGLGLRFAGNPGAMVENHLLINLYNALLRPYDLSALLVVAALAMLVAIGWHSKPILLRRGLWIALPMGVLYVVLGTYGEIRVFYELMPIVFLLCAQTLAGWFGLPMSARDNLVNQEAAE